MANAERRLYWGLVAVFAAVHGIHLICDERGRVIQIGGIDEIVRGHMERVPSRSDEIDGLILGGSNAMFGVSAELLSELTGHSFYNLGMPGEGFNRENYLNFVKSATSSLDRNRIQLILIASRRILRSAWFPEDDGMDLYGKSRSLIEPRESLLKRAYEKLIAYKNPAEKHLDRFKIAGDFGDVDFEGYVCDFRSDEESLERPSIEQASEYLDEITASYQALFPNAKIILVAPGEFNSDPGGRERFLSQLSIQLKKRNLNFIALSAHQLPELICDVPLHPNAVGRELRTRELAGLIRPPGN